MLRSLAVAAVLLPLALPATALATVIQSLNGDVRVGTSGQTLIEGREGQHLAPGTTVVTGRDAQVILQFDDEQRMVLGQNTEFRIVDFQYSKASPSANRGVFDLLKGALRVVTGAVASTNRTAWALRTPQMTIGVRGTDFMVVVTNQAYVRVTQGAISLSNGAGTAVFGAGAAGSVASSTALAASVPASSLPAAASGAFGSLAAAPVGAAPGGAAAGAAATATGATTGGVGLGTIAIGVGAAAALGAAGGGGGGNATTTHH